ncbi:MAG TPA: hypothetical protein VFU45_00740 [Gemmatimonadales bacterium]|nr:hypothetical protein [Gemmatimonadales bacterium]
MGPRAVPLLALQHRAVRSPLGVALSIVLHILVLALLIAPWAYFDPEVRAGLVAALTGGGGGGGRGGDATGVAYISVPAPKAPPPSAPTPVPTPVSRPTVPQVPDATDVAPPVDSAVSPAKGVAAPGQADGAGKGGGTGGGEGPGSGTGSGSATGPGKGGNGGKGTPPDPRQMIIPPNGQVPKALRGRMLAVTFWVTETGDVARVSETPPIEDAKYRRAFEEAMLAYRFRPARDSLGRPTAATIVITQTLGTR